MLPPVLTTIAETRALVAAVRREGKTIGLVPTMGALHAGHISLVRTARLKMDYTIVSIFVNPTQFGPSEDFSRYPRTLESDRELCGAVGTDLIFCPTPAEMYPQGFSTFVEVTELGDHLCGPTRPGHFRGVATVVLKLFNIILPDVAFFGQKDAQQARIILQMVRDLDLMVRVEVLPTVRESDGLAMSSRNRYLDPIQRKNASALYRCLQRLTLLVETGERSIHRLEEIMAQEIASTPGAHLDYARIVDAQTLKPIELLQAPAIAALAVFMGGTRLIDNVTLTP